MAGIIKAGGEARCSSGLQTVAFNFEDMTDKANGYLGVVHQQAQEIIARAEKEAIRIRQRAEQEGRQAAAQAAEKNSQAKLDQRLQTLMPALVESVRSIQRSKSAWLNQWENNAVHLAAAIASRVIRRELAQCPDITLELVREALELASNVGRLKLRLNPQDYQTLGDRAKQLAAQIRELAPVDVVADPEVQPGGCCLDTEFGSIDQQIETQLARIEQELT